MSIIFRKIALVRGRVHVITKDGDRTLRIDLFDSVEDAEEFRIKSERQDPRVRFQVNEMEYQARTPWPN